MLNPGQVYVTLSRLERAGLVAARQVAQSSPPDKKVYEVTAAGRERVAAWLAGLVLAKVAPVEFHLKLVAAAATRLADPVALIDAQRRELLRQLREVQRLARRPPDGDGALLLEGAALRLQADIRWLEVCEQRWTSGRRDEHGRRGRGPGAALSRVTDEPVRAVDGVDLVVEPGEAVSVMGPSGCGKSTLLHLLGGLERPTPATCRLGGAAGRPAVARRLGDVAPPRRSGSCSRRSTSSTS